MSKAKKTQPTSNSQLETPGERLEKVILKYFKTQKTVADLLGATESTLNSYIKGRYNITKKFALRLQDKAEISSNYILNGREPMMADESIQPIFEGNVPTISKLDTKTKHGIVKQYILEYEGSQQILRDNGEGSVVNIVLGNLEEDVSPFVIKNFMSEFEIDYNVRIGVTLVLKKDYKNNDIVLFLEDGFYKIGTVSKDAVKELKGNTYKLEDVDIKGRIIGKFENAKVDKTTGRIF